MKICHPRLTPANNLNWLVGCLSQINQLRKQSESSSESCWKGKLTRPAGFTEAIHFPLVILSYRAGRVPGSKGHLGCLKVCWTRWVLHLLHSMCLHTSVGQTGLITAAAQWARINWQFSFVCGPDQYMWVLMVSDGQILYNSRAVRIMTMY